MQNVKKSIALLTAFFAVLCLFSACFSPWQGDSKQGTLTLNFGPVSAGIGGAGRSIAYEPEGIGGVSRSIVYEPGGIGPGADIGELEFRVQLSGPGGNRTETVQGGTVRLSLAAGSWTVQVNAYYQGVLYAVSDSFTVNVSAGENNNAAVQMRPATQAWNDEDFGAGAAVEYRYFSAGDEDTALESYLGDMAGTPGNHVIVVEGDQHKLTPQTIATNDVKISLRGSGTVTLASNGSMFKLDTNTSGNKLILRGPKLVGRSNNNAPLVNVNSGEFVMHAGEINGNITATNNGGGVYVSGFGSLFTMSGGTIRGNQSMYGGGVHVGNSGSGTVTFTMSGGSISDNRGDNAGGGVYVDNSGNGTVTFDISGGTISGNTTNMSGGGVYVRGLGSLFTMSGGTISGNGAAMSGGGGVYVDSDSTFTMSGNAVISNNTSDNDGGGVFVTSATFDMQGGEISGNNQAANGGGVFVDGSGGSFAMSGTAVISGNNATMGGGVYVTPGTTFTMNTGSTISGNTAERSAGGSGIGFGGGVYVDGGTFNLQGGTITGNYAKDINNTGGGGIYCDGTLNLGPGPVAIEHNHAKLTANGSAMGGGIMIDSNGSMNFNGTPCTVTINDNWAEGSAPNVDSSQGGGIAYFGTSAINIPAGFTITNNHSDSYTASAGGVYDSNGSSITYDPAVIWGGNYASGHVGIGTVGAGTPTSGHDKN